MIIFNNYSQVGLVMRNDENNECIKQRSQVGQDDRVVQWVYCSIIYYYLLDYSRIR